MKHIVDVKINNKTYTIKSEKPAEYIEQIASILNKEIEILTKEVSVTQAQVMISFNFIDKFFEQQQKNEHLCEQLNKYMKENEKLKTEIQELYEVI